MGVRCRIDGGVIDEDAYIETYAVPAVRDFIESSYISFCVTVSAIKFNAIGPDGRYVDTTTTHAQYVEDFGLIQGPESSLVEPQRALAVTWLTAALRGLASKGRVYLPGFAAPVDTGLIIGTGTAGSQEDAATAFISALAADPVVVPSIMSNRGGGVGRPITGVKVGRAIDTQRRRRRSLSEEYVD